MSLAAVAPSLRLSTASWRAPALPHLAGATSQLDLREAQLRRLRFCRGRLLVGVQASRVDAPLRMVAKRCSRACIARGGSSTAAQSRCSATADAHRVHTTQDNTSDGHAIHAAQLWHSARGRTCTLRYRGSAATLILHFCCASVPFARPTVSGRVEHVWPSRLPAQVRRGMQAAG